MAISLHLRARACRLRLAGALVVCAAGCGGADASGADDVPQIRLESTPFDVPSGEEMLICQYFPAMGSTLWLDGFDSGATEGLHHLNIYRVHDDGTFPTAPFSCTGDVVPLPGLLPLTPHHESLPDGIAYEVKPDEGFMLNMHFINTTGATLSSSAHWEARLRAAADVTAPAGMLIQAQHGFDVPPDSEMKLTRTCSAPQDMQVYFLAGHFHDYTTEFVASVDGEQVLDLDQGSMLHGLNWEPPRDVRAGEQLSWTCDVQNTTPDPITFGYSTTKNEMCEIIAYIYPVATSAAIGCDE